MPSRGGPTGTFIENFPAVQPITFDSPQHVVVDSLPSGASSVVDVSDRTTRLLGHVIVDSAPASGADVTDRSARLLGHVTVDNASLSVTGTFWQTTQPVSLATNTPDVTDRAARLLGHVTVDNASLAVTGTFWQATQPVSGTFWQATQPVSIASMPSTPVTGTFWPATQPVSATALPLPTGAATAANQPAINADGGSQTHVMNFPATQPVSGTFWQATQPVSIASMPSTPVTGTFWQATQPVSLATNTPDVTDRSARLLGHVNVDNASLAVTGTFFQATQPVSGTFWQTTQPVSLATNTPDVTDRAARLLGHVTVDNASLAVTGTFFQATQPISAASLPLPTGAALDATLTGGTQRNRVTDGTNNAAVKAASTQAVAADPALVVAWSPNMGPSANSILPSAAATINATVVKASAGRLYKIKGYNAAAAIRYLKFWNKATTPAPATDTALIMFNYPLKASDQFDIDLTPIGFAFSTGIGYTISTGSANADATAVTAADIVGLNVMYA
jgi:hypothetical protein